MPQCSYVAAYMEKNKEYADLRAEACPLIYDNRAEWMLLNFHFSEKITGFAENCRLLFTVAICRQGSYHALAIAFRVASANLLFCTLINFSSKKVRQG